jgi:hypothetical protein
MLDQCNADPLQTWTVESIEARRRTGDVLVTVGNWAVSFDTSSEWCGSRLNCVRFAPGASLKIEERDPRDGDIFPSTVDAECYALNAGRLQWYRDWKAAQVTGKGGGAVMRCSTCDIVLADGKSDHEGRCFDCWINNARRVPCCGYLYDGETCGCATEPPRCVDCCEVTDGGELCAPCIDRRDDKWVGRCAGELQPPVRCDLSRGGA